MDFNKCGLSEVLKKELGRWELSKLHVLPLIMRQARDNINSAMNAVKTKAKDEKKLS